MDRNTKQTRTPGELKLPRTDQFLEFPSSVSKKEQNEFKNTSGLELVDKSKLVKAETEHFIAYGATERQAESVGRNAEAWLKMLKNDWFGEKSAMWPKKVELIANVNSDLGQVGRQTLNMI